MFIEFLQKSFLKIFRDPPSPKIKPKLKILYMKMAYLYADMSRDKRRKNGCVIVKDLRIISTGYNGTPNGWDNTCQDENGNTKLEVLHAETNSIAKLARSHESSENSVLFCTTMPCFDCAKLIYQSGIKEVYYNQTYRKLDGFYFLKKCKIKIEQLNIE